MMIMTAEEGNHGSGPESPTLGQVSLVEDELAGVANDDHDGGGDSEAHSLAEEGLRVELHDEEDLKEQERHGQEPVHVSVGIVEGLSGGVRGDGVVGSVLVHVLHRGVFVGFRPRVEDPEVVVRSYKRY